MSISSEAFQLGKFKFRSTSSNVDIFFQDEVRDEEEQSDFSAEQLKEEYQRGVDETTQALQPQIDQLTQQASEQQQTFQGKINALSTSLQEHLKIMEKEVFEQVCNMSFTLAELILQKEVIDKEDLAELIKKSLSEIHSETKVTIKLSKDDFPLLGEKFTSSRTECISDPSINPGEAKIDHQHGFLDLTLKSRLAELKEHFNNVRTSGDEKDA